MRLLAFVLIWGSLALGAVSATTAYMWTFPAEGEADAFRIGEDAAGEPVYAVLASPAGIDAEGQPVVGPDTPLSPETVERLRAESLKPVERVKVKGFSFGRWTHLPHFIAACVGLLAGAMLTRLNAARALRQVESRTGKDAMAAPEDAIAELRAVVGELIEQLPLEPDERRACERVTDRLGLAIRDLVPPIVEQRDRLVARMGLGSYAALMDVFASAERAMNRAWSAAADQHLDESLESLELASERLAVAEAKLTGRTPSVLPLG
jgi:hypothetical protein